MKEKALFSILLLCMIASTVVMVFVLKSIDSVQSRTASAGPGGFSSVMQLERTLEGYANALEEYRYNIGDPELIGPLSAQYQKEFDIVWGNLEFFNLRFPEEHKQSTKLSNYKHDAMQFLQSTDAIMANDIVLSSDQVTAVLSDLQFLQDGIHELGREYFVSSIAFRDSWVNDINKLHKLLYIFSTALIAAAGLLVALLVRSNIRKHTLFVEAESTRSELRSKVAELRSGKLEQRAKDSFMASASHDLSQPLHALGLFLGSLQSHVTDSRGKETLNEAVQCSNNLGDLFKSLLDMSRLDAGIVNVQKIHFNLNELLGMLEHEFQQKTQNLGVRLNFHMDDAVAYSDPILLSRILRNLIENSLVHSEAELITVSCISANGNLHLSIEDNGRGISEHEQLKVFSEYYQVKNTSSSSNKGLGLGLSIVHRLANLLEIDIALESLAGQFTRFTLHVPLGNSREVVQSANNVEVEEFSVPEHDVIVAVVDDDEKICAAMSMMLDNMGIDAVTGTTTDSLIDKLVESNKLPDLIVADYRLSKGQTGDQAIIQLKRALNIDVPALLVTGDTSPVHVSHAASSGFELLHKPIEPTELSRIIKQMLLESIQSSALAPSGQRPDRSNTIEIR